jgi:LacI family transcriptional regulator
MSIRAVAELAGVAPSTVSLSINRPEQVADETREAVLRAMDTLEYQPRARGRPRKTGEPRTAANRTNRVALLAVGETSVVLQAPIYMNVVRGVESALSKMNTTLVMRRVSVPLTVPLLASRVDGIIFVGEPDDPQLRAEITKLPCVQVMSLIREDATWDHVSFDNSRVGKIAAEYLLNRGHRNCAYAGEFSKQGSVGRERRTMFQRFAEQGGASVKTFLRESLYIKGDGAQRVNRPLLASLLDEMLRQRPRPTALFVEADLLTSVLYSLLYERGLVPGKDLEIVSCNNENLLLQGLHPRPATIDTHAEDIGRRAVEILAKRIENPTAPRVSLTLEPELVTLEG